MSNIEITVSGRRPQHRVLEQNNDPFVPYSQNPVPHNEPEPELEQSPTPAPIPEPEPAPEPDNNDEQ